jgi:hypothetical protein
MHHWSSLVIPGSRGPDSPRRIAPAAVRLRGATPGSERPPGSAKASATGVRLGRVGRSSGARRSWCTHHARRAIMAEAGMSGAKPWSSRSWNSSMCREWPVTAIKPVSRSDIPASATPSPGPRHATPGTGAEKERDWSATRTRGARRLLLRDQLASAVPESVLWERSFDEAVRSILRPT